MSFFVMPYTFTAVGRFKIVQSLSALNGPLFWAFDKKRHTHVP